jgi:hypothetical protein
MPSGERERERERSWCTGGLPVQITVPRLPGRGSGARQGCILLLLLLLLLIYLFITFLFTAIELSLGGSNAYSSTVKTNKNKNT